MKALIGSLTLGNWKLVFFLTFSRFFWLKLGENGAKNCLFRFPLLRSESPIAHQSLLEYQLLSRCQLKHGLTRCLSLPHLRGSLGIPTLPLGQSCLLVDRQMLNASNFCLPAHAIRYISASLSDQSHLFTSMF